MDAARAAVAADLPAIVALVAELRAELSPLRGGAVWSRREARTRVDAAVFAGLLERDDAHVVVGTFHDAVVGVGTCTIAALHDGTHLGVVDELYVTPDARAVGVGEQMLDALVAWCVARGCTGMDVLALPGHRAAKNFFEGAGFTARAIVMHRSLEP